MSRVFILGAGASAGFPNSENGVTPPVSKTFFDKAISLASRGHVNFDDYPNLNNFLLQYYNRDLSVANGLDIEEVLTYIDMAENNEARDDLLRFIAVVLDRTLYGTQCPYHSRLLDCLRPQDVVINFNWDLILDNIVAVSNQHPEYCSDALKVIDAHRLNGDERQTPPKILKLHGSLNWMECKSCSKTFAFMLEGKTATRHYQGMQKPCPECNGDTKPLLIPPTLLKSYEHRVIKDVWRRAEIALSNAEEVTVIGYSLPPTDFRAKWLFLESAAHRRRVQRQLRIRLFDLDPGAIRERLAHVFGVPAHHVECATGGIKEASRCLIRSS